jgi:hypothetical protein
MKKTLTLFAALYFFAFSQAQDKTWTDADRKYLLDNLIRSKEELIKETSHLTDAQWRFHESKDRWSINEIIEHIGLWEILLMDDVSRALRTQPQPNKLAQPDSLTYNFIMESKKHFSLDYTKPYSYTIPFGLDEGKNNLTKVTKWRDQSIDYIKTTKDNLRIYFATYGTVHQTFILIFGHADRHLRQIRKVKQHPNYPK